MIKITARAKAFSGEPIQKYSFLVNPETKSVRVYDSIAGYYTDCNSLSKPAKARIYKLATRGPIGP